MNGTEVIAGKAEGRKAQVDEAQAEIVNHLEKWMTQERFTERVQASIGVSESLTVLGIRGSK